MREVIRLPSATTPGHPVASDVSLEVDAVAQSDDSGLVASVPHPLPAR